MRVSDVCGNYAGLVGKSAGIQYFPYFGDDYCYQVSGDDYCYAFLKGY